MSALSVGKFASVLPASIRSAVLYRVDAATSRSLLISFSEFVTVQVTTGESRPHEATREVFGVASQIGSRFKCP